MKWLLATASLLLSASGFVSRPRVCGTAATASSRPSSDCNMLLKPEKFDRVIETKRNSIGYDSDSGRFFELQSEPVTESVSTESVSTKSVTESTSLVDSAATSDIPPIPDAGFGGMNVTGEINGVKMTSGGSRRRKQETNLLPDGDPSVADQAPTDGNNRMRSNSNFADRITNSGAVSAAAVATATAAAAANATPDDAAAARSATRSA